MAREEESIESTEPTLRSLLLADLQHGLDSRWRIPGKPNEREQALMNGEAVTVGAADILRALSRAKLPYAQFAFGGEHWGSTFALGEDDELRVLSA